MHVAIITAGGAGMYCGSCMLDNAWAKSLIDAGVEVSLIPMYTPLRLDESSQANARVFAGGINMYLNQKSTVWRRLPSWLKAPFNSRWLLSFASKLGVSHSASELGELTEATVRAEEGPFREAWEELSTFVARLNPDVVIYSNSMLLGSLRLLKQIWSGPCYCVLQGDDVFLKSLPEPHQTRVIQRLCDRTKDFDGFIVHSEFYRNAMSSFLRIPLEKFRCFPLAIDTSHHYGTPRPSLGSPPRIGYFARMSPEKGLLQAVQGAVFAQREIPELQLVVGGYRSREYRDYLEQVELAARPLGDRLIWADEVNTISEKSRLLSSSDLFCFPSQHGEPKGLPVLEACANGVPVVVTPDGALPELVNSLEGGLVAPTHSSESLGKTLVRLLQDHELRRNLANQAWKHVRERHSVKSLVKKTLELL